MPLTKKETEHEEIGAGRSTKLAINFCIDFPWADFICTEAKWRRLGGNCCPAGNFRLNWPSQIRRKQTKQKSKELCLLGDNRVTEQEERGERKS